MLLSDLIYSEYHLRLDNVHILCIVAHTELVIHLESFQPVNICSKYN